jgi:hypothetical protein
MANASFLTDSSWPASVLDALTSAQAQGAPQSEHRYYGAYEFLLNYCFDSRGGLIVSPQTLVPGTQKTIDFGVLLYTPMQFGKPDFIFEVKNDNWLGSAG